MLANNNQGILSKMCRRSLVRNKQKFGIITAAIMLSAFMLFSVLTVGVTYFKNAVSAGNTPAGRGL